jgi:predicted RNA binding protein YcfA (HicA-like mRNA interferase family)
MVKFAEIRKRLTSDGWQVVRTKNNSEQWTHRQTAGRITLAGKDDEIVAPRTYESIARQAGW